MLLLLTAALAATLSVGPGQPHSTVGAALAVAIDGDEVVIDPGTYVEDLTVTAEIVIRGAGQGVTTLRSAGGARVVQANDDVRIEGLSIDCGGQRGVRQNASNVRRLQLVDVEIFGCVSPTSASVAPSAVDVWEADLLIADSWIHDNSSEVAAVGTYGGVRIFGSLFENNVTDYAYGAGAVYVLPLDGQRVRVVGNTFVGNRSTTDGGAVTVMGGRWQAPKDRIAGNVFIDNHSDGMGGAVYVTADVSFSETLYVNVVDNLFVANDAARGGAVGIDGTSYGYTYAYTLGTVWVRLSRNTFVDNTATLHGSHVYGGPTSTIEALNLLMAHGNGPEGYYTSGAGSQDHLLTWGNVADGGGTGWVPGGSSIVADPLFTTFSDDGDPGNDDLALLPGSPAIDAGSPDCADDADGSPSDIGVLP